MQARHPDQAVRTAFYLDTRWIQLLLHLRKYDRQALEPQAAKDEELPLVATEFNPVHKTNHTITGGRNKDRRTNVWVVKEMSRITTLLACSSIIRGKVSIGDNLNAPTVAILISVGYDYVLAAVYMRGFWQNPGCTRLVLRCVWHIIIHNRDDHASQPKQRAKTCHSTVMGHQLDRAILHEIDALSPAPRPPLTQTWTACFQDMRSVAKKG
ncbi:hypothetical protein HD554DRAFT_2039991 [Boletus coccyginus]|nr:hypothetical protein HD554DRAFT_2039991 [Boletus coccyginus]